MKATKKSLSGTSFHTTTINTTPAQLIELAKSLGAEYHEDNCGLDKSNFDFEFETNRGEVFTIYDWKYYRSLRLNEVIKFNIGAQDWNTSNEAKSEILQMLLKTKFGNGYSKETTI